MWKRSFKSVKIFKSVPYLITAFTSTVPDLLSMDIKLHWIQYLRMEVKK